MKEAERRKKLAEMLSPENMQALCIEAKAARQKLLNRVSGCDEREVINLRISMENLLSLLDEFRDSRTEN